MSMNLDDVRFDERGLVPAIVQDARTREVLTLAYMNCESLRLTLEEGETWFWSRSRSTLWHKGAVSGNTQRVVEIRLDCDSDAIVVLVEPKGPACHTGARSCFQPQADSKTESAVCSDDAKDESDLGAVLANLFDVIERRRSEMPEGSYTSYLFAEGVNKILKKVGEETSEVIIAAKDEDANALTNELSDLFYHLLVLMVERGVSIETVAGELSRRGK